jgi:hypothetical protein
MSETRQTRKSGDAISTSALPPTADIPESGCDVRKVPITDIQKRSLDHFVCLSRSIGGTMIPTSCLFTMM